MTKKIITQSFDGRTFSATSSNAPVICMVNDYTEAVPAVVNFLRFGCPLVQLVDIADRREGKLIDEWFTRFVNRIRCVELNGEEFIITKENVYTFSVTRKTKRGNV